MARPRIQIVEDEAIIAADIEEALTGLHYDVVGIASSGSDALNLARSKRPDLILMDVHIEGPMDGIETAEIVAKELGTPVVFLTAFADSATFSRAKELEPQGYVLKPFRQMELRTVIDLALHKHSQEQKRKDKVPVEEIKEEKPQRISFKEKVALPLKPTPVMKNAAKAKLLGLAPFSALPDELLEEISHVCFISSFRNFDVIVHEGRELQFGFLVLTGRIAIFKKSPGGKELALDLIAPDDLFPLVSLLKTETSFFSARSQGDSQVMWVPREVMTFLAEHYSQVNQSIIANVLDRLRKAHDFSRALAHDKVEVRVSSALRMLAERFGEKVGDSINLVLTRQELAELVGTTPETISRVFSHYVEDQALDISMPGIVSIKSVGYLEKVGKG